MEPRVDVFATTSEEQEQAARNASLRRCESSWDQFNRQHQFIARVSVFCAGMSGLFLGVLAGLCLLVSFVLMPVSSLFFFKLIAGTLFVLLVSLSCLSWVNNRDREVRSDFCNAFPREAWEMGWLANDAPKLPCCGKVK